MKPDVVDDHFYRRAQEFYDDVHHYDQTDRNGPKIFVGEWATREGLPTPNFGSALGDAAWMTGMERNSDIVIMASYAPLLVNVNPGGMQWESDLIGYDAMNSYGSPSYYAQVMFSNHFGDQILNATLDGTAPKLFYSVTRKSSDGTIYLKLVNASSTPQPLRLQFKGASTIDKTGKLITLSAKTTAATNSITQPTAIMPVESELHDAAAAVCPYDSRFHHSSSGVESKMRTRWFLALFLLLSPWLRAKADIQYFPERKVWVLQAGETTYAFGVNERGELQPIYWGQRVMRDADFPAAHIRPEVASFDLSATTTPQEYPGWGAEFYNEPALKATYTNGNRDVVLHYVDQHIDGNTLEITLKDINTDLDVHLYYRVYPETGILERWSRIENKTDQAITLESAQSASWTLPQGEGYGWHYLTGHWGGEWQLHSEPLQTGARVIESRRGSTSHQSNPWFAIDRPQQTTEESGPVWFGALGWSGSWRITVEQTAMQQVRVTGGFNPFDFGYHLKPGRAAGNSAVLRRIHEWRPGRGVAHFASL